MNTAFLLMAQYEGRAIIPVEDVCRDYFPHLNRTKFLRKIRSGELPLTVVEIEESQKAARGVHLSDLADYLDSRREKALRRQRRLHA